MIVTLSPVEVLQGEWIGRLRNKAALAKGRQNRYGLAKDAANDLHISVIGALAELAVSKAFNRYWFGNYMDEIDRNAADVSYDLQVRTRKTQKADAELLMHPKDIDEHYYILVIGQAPTLNVVGGILGRDGKRDEWWQERVPGRPCYWIPQSELLSVDEIKKLIV